MPVDYAALAKQAGATSSVASGAVDYAALAKQAGATESVAAPSSRPAGLPAGVELPGASSAPVPAALTNPTSTRGPIESFSDASGLSGLGHALLHPFNTITGIPHAIAGGVRGAIDDLHGETDALRNNGLSVATRQRLVGDIPILGSALKNAQLQHEAGNDSGMIGTLAGTVAGVVGPGIVGKVLPGIAGSALTTASKALKIAGASGDSLKLAGSRILAPGTVGETLIRATKPGVKYGPAGEIAQSYSEALPKALAENPKLNTVRDLGKAYDAAKETNHGQYAAWREPHASMPIDTTPLVGAQIDSIPATNEFETPGIIKATKRRALPYDMTPRTETSVSPILGADGNPIKTTKTITPTPPTLGMVDAIRSDTNAKLNSFYNKEGGDQAAALSNPRTARIKAVNDGTRDLVYGALSEANGIPEDVIRNHQRMYGQLSDAGNAANKRGVVFDRQDPVSLAAKIAAGHGGPIATGFNFAKEKLIQSMTNSDGLVASAVDRYRNPLGTPLVSGTSPLQQGLTKASKYIRPSGPISSIPMRFLIPPALALHERNDD